jgi:small-conductance mechanosensitive channel
MGRARGVAPALIAVCALAATAAAQAPVMPPIALVSAGPGGLPDADRILGLLNDTLSWRSALTVEHSAATTAEDALRVADHTTTAAQIVQLAFDFARGAAPLVERTPSAGTGVESRYDSLGQLASQLEQQVSGIQREIESGQRRLGEAHGDLRPLQSQLAELQAELALSTARRDAVRGMWGFVSGSTAGGVGGTGLRARIEALAATARDVPAAPAAGGPTAAAGNSAARITAAAPAAGATSVTVPADAGAVGGSLWDLTTAAFALRNRMIDLTALERRTEQLARSSRAVATPMIRLLQQLSAQGDALARQADTTAIARLGEERVQLDALATQFKAVSSALLPLAEQGVLLDRYREELLSWRADLGARYHSQLLTLGLHVATLLCLLALVALAAELWKRAVYRYVLDSRRRHRLLLLRRLAVWMMVIVILGANLASRLDSFVTFAGLLTAGIAVALQNLILSVVGHFFLIGKYGVRAGDRVQIGEVIGEVIDVGLVRLHLMELTHADGKPTGRIVAFSNAVVFQATAGVFKQLPGVNFGWHEVTLLLPAAVDYATAKQRLLEAMTQGLASYRDDLERQNRQMESETLTMSEHALEPSVRLRYVAGGIEATVRYPVDLRHAAEIDGAVDGALRALLAQEPRLQGVGGAEAQLRPGTG